MLLIDGDLIKYAAAAQCEKTEYKVEGKIFSTVKAARDYSFDAGNAPIESIVELEAPHFVKIYANKIIQSIKDRFEGDDCRIYLSGNTNFRNTIATIRDYKGNRDRRRTPQYLEYARDFLISEGAIVCEGEEADDGLGINQTDTTVICTIDKDLDLVPGWHYNWVLDNFYYVNQDEADYKFAKQLLTGDYSDNVVGLDGVGDARAISILHNSSGRTEWGSRVRNAYSSRNVLPTLQEMGTLLWIRRKPNQMWTMEDWENNIC